MDMMGHDKKIIAHPEIIKIPVQTVLKDSNFDYRGWIGWTMMRKS